MALINYLIAGGPVMIPIGVASVVGLAAFLERLWSLRRQAVLPRALVAGLLDLLRQGRVADAQTLCRQYDAPLSRVALRALEAQGKPRAAIKERLEEAGRREAADLERFLPVLATIGALGPLLGLLGTVGGMIVTFESVRVAGAGDVQDLAGGIAQALITTFAGLCVAIPAVVAHRTLLSKVDGLLVELEEISITILDLVAAKESP